MVPLWLGPVYTSYGIMNSLAHNEPTSITKAIIIGTTAVMFSKTWF